MKSAEGEYIDKKSEDFYMKAFLEHISCKEECIHCKYRRFERAGDIAIGDYWGVEDNDDKGVSLILVNSIKGKEVFERLNRLNFKYKKVYNVFNNAGLNRNTSIFASRKYFFDNLDKEDFETLYNNSNNPKHNVAIASMLFQNNFGAVLTVYALYKTIEDLGYNPLIIYNNFYSNNLFEDIKGNKFGLKYLNIANEYFNKEELKKLNEKCSAFIVGSDQVFRWLFNRKNLSHYLLDFVYNFKNKIAYSSSFGISNFEGELKDKIFFKYYLKQFDKVSVREDDGVRICKEDFDVEATHVLDPVFLINDYDYLISKSNKNVNHKFIAVYSLYTNIENELNFISNKLSLNIEYLNINDKNDIEDWLWTIKNCELFITDSFHGICFAIIFNKPFVGLLLNEVGGFSRLESLSNMFDIKDRIITDLSEVMNKIDFLLKMDYTEINKKLEIEKAKSLNWLKNALENKKEKYDYKDDIINFLINENTDLNNKINDLYSKNFELYNQIDCRQNWVKLFGIYNTKEYLIFYFFGIKISFRMNEEIVNKLAWWIPIRKWRDNFRSKFF